MGHRESSPKREIHSNTGLPQETRKTGIKQCNVTPKESRNRKTKPSEQKHGNNIKIKVEIDKIASK